ncbi:MAG: nucleotidyltransferase domain-containing protein [Betaproteobacteria bacterium]
MRTRPAATDPAAVLFGRSMRAVLGLLFNHPERAFYLREIARAAGTSPSSLQRELAALAAAGLVVREARGRQVYFRANGESPLFQELRGIVVKTFGVADVLRGALAPLSPRIRAAFVYGSLARGEARPESDVDVMVVGEVAFADVAERLLPAEAALRRSVNPTVYPSVELSEKAAAGNAFLAEVLQGPKIFLIGEERELRALAEGGAPQAPKARKAGNRRPRRAGR